MLKRISMIGAALAMTVLIAVLVAPSARANNVTNDITLQGGTNYFGALHTDNQDFTDIFTFNAGDLAGAISVSVSLSTIGSGASNIDFIGAVLNGVPLSISVVEDAEFGYLTHTFSPLSGPLQLTITGLSGASGGTFASYAGTINVIPEPSTTLMMGLGLGGLGLAARRARA